MRAPEESALVIPQPHPDAHQAQQQQPYPANRLGQLLSLQVQSCYH